MFAWTIQSPVLSVFHKFHNKTKFVCGFSNKRQSATTAKAEEEKKNVLKKKMLKLKMLKKCTKENCSSGEH